ncbi:MAG TPA: hypothetical protein VFZ09_21715 [Archangium sp.]|uniref:hypothetical protein n=1 Tax=Archangium sp. TaxID=1872627 RepID=UPI002E2FACE0|nr:hypothetical protein [Archangium sp.]HEX5748873.1 hypothetical protein [Archangium sp.]
MKNLLRHSGWLPCALALLGLAGCEAPPSAKVPELAESQQAVTDRPPTGWLDGVDGVRAFGWACDPDTPTTPVEVHLYFGGPPGGSTTVYGVSGILANRPSEAGVNSACGGGTAHRFEWYMPADLRDYLGALPYPVYAYAITPTASAGLNGMPKTMVPGAATRLTVGYGTGQETVAQTGGVYSYAPTIAYVDGKYRLWACSSQAPYQGDVVIYSESVDGISWSQRVTVMNRYSPASGSPIDPNMSHTCDPSVVTYTPPGSSQRYYYMYVTTAGSRGGMITARSTSPTGPFSFYMGGDPNAGTSWNANPPAGAYPAVIHPSTTNLGQSSVVRVGSTFHMWYTEMVNGFIQIFYTTSTNGVSWSSPQPTAWAEASVDVKYDPVMRRFVLADINPDHLPLPQSLRIVTSTNGIHWSELTVANGNTNTGLPKYVHNVGISGDGNGHLLTGARNVVGYGAPYELNDPYYVENPNDQIYGTCSGGAPPHCRPYWHTWVAPLFLSWSP